MAYKTRTKSKELIILESLNSRGNLTKKDKQRYFNMKKGFAGEIQFDAYTEKLQNECSIINDLLLEVNGTTFQIDSLVIIQGKIYMYEVKTMRVIIITNPTGYIKSQK
ncbi:nuclease-related domain-containing protein [Virgibacillus sp. 179-BFC.A HS]|uniref:Nuclease-related domain-containing protein n=1 Tax=Tigheibacillus jepli TaxID=3035914 RepID=A0ABU5CG18_9BACI|nr:nuclease-related domain-containing protein [Virgibacillus sp. 179-BFC.A HS]MDY0405261.1 nuclease-related domain-containing protein [Virgibacillus sp. 179-BFC.A HS]